MEQTIFVLLMPFKILVKINDEKFNKCLMIQRHVITRFSFIESVFVNVFENNTFD